MEQSGRDEGLGETCRAVVRAMQVVGTSICIGAHPGGCTPHAWSSPAAQRLHWAQTSSGQGPCVEARSSGVPVIVDDLTTIERWAQFRAAAQRFGVAATLVHPLTGDAGTVGALALYDSSPRAWTPEDRAMVELVAHLVTTIVAQRADNTELRSANERMRSTLDHRAVIEQAKGMIARDHSIPVETAFEWLRRHSRNTNTPVRDVAIAVVELGLHVPRPPAEPRRGIAIAQRRTRQSMTPRHGG
jgi:GAF domain-containing protein